MPEELTTARATLVELRTPSMNSASKWGPASQTWHIEVVNDGVNFNYVRFQNRWLNIYLNAVLNRTKRVARGTTSISP